VGGMSSAEISPRTGGDDQLHRRRNPALDAGARAWRIASLVSAASKETGTAPAEARKITILYHIV
jgi:hypothetical protein